MWKFSVESYAMSAAQFQPGSAISTLTASGLVYDPRHYLLSIIDKPAAVEEMPRWAIRDIYLEEKESRRQKLLVLRGPQPLEIGPYLREPEREWLAEVLWRWARSPASTP